MKTENFT